MRFLGHCCRKRQNFAPGEICFAPGENVISEQPVHSAVISPQAKMFRPRRKLISEQTSTSGIFPPQAKMLQISQIFICYLPLHVVSNQCLILHDNGILT
ncbi:unnamed protein product [Trifolium pratense]|uniref:Uncharacterized protein n=1 Tax=Trifolium pratense TaxID=57577 RepID=A0ACB0K8D6_TRIPR|nr:unnamed protein product [Trifolium pratense]